MLTMVTFLVTIVNMIRASQKYTKKLPTQKKHGDLANSLVEIAVEYISKNKSTEFALRDLASKLGVSHTAAYRHFKSKNALLEHIAMKGFEKMNTYFQECLASTKSPLEDLGRAYIQFALKFPGYYRVMFGVNFDHNLNPELFGACQGAFDSLLNLFGKNSKTNSVKAIYAWSLVHGLVMLTLDGQLEKPLEDANLSYKEMENKVLKITHMLLNSN
ncbi:MAG: TetR/AcrR family transcriptional regulator [Bacteriovoracaceae bacterium]|nr:TetR/AcrR family transcriptional regulator [Bacteriovoracaceae bacterium]